MPNTFSNLLSLHYIDLSYNRITQIIADSFLNLTNLYTITLKHNYVSYIHQDAFINLSSIDTINLSNNNLTKIEVGTFANLSRLQNLFLSYNYLTTLQTNLFSLRMLTTNSSKINDNNFYYLNSYNLNNIEYDGMYIYLDHNNISYIDPNAFINTKKIFGINLSYNNISEISPSTFTNLHKLKSIDLSYNNISEISPSTFINLHKLESINLSYNNISEISPSTFINLHKLESIDLSYNRIEIIDSSSFANLPIIESIDLSYNNIFDNDINIDAIYIAIPNLNSINVNNNCLSEVIEHWKIDVFADNNFMPGSEYVYIFMNILFGVNHNINSIQDMINSHNILIWLINEYPGIKNIIYRFSLQNQQSKKIAQKLQLALNITKLKGNKQSFDEFVYLYGQPIKKLIQRYNDLCAYEYSSSRQKNDKIQLQIKKYLG